MNFLADENLETSIIKRLREDGHQVWSVAEMEPGILDDEVLNRANQSSAILLTNDKDFGELVFRLQQTPCGVILIRLAGLTNDEKAKTVSQVIQRRGEELPGAFTVISPKVIRIRKLDL